MEGPKRAVTDKAPTAAEWGGGEGINRILTWIKTGKPVHAGWIFAGSAGSLIIPLVWIGGLAISILLGVSKLRRKQSAVFLVAAIIGATWQLGSAALISRMTAGGNKAQTQQAESSLRQQQLSELLEGKKLTTKDDLKPKEKDLSKLSGIEEKVQQRSWATTLAVKQSAPERNRTEDVRKLIDDAGKLFGPDSDQVWVSRVLLAHCYTRSADPKAAEEWASLDTHYHGGKVSSDAFYYLAMRGDSLSEGTAYDKALDVLEQIHKTPPDTDDDDGRQLPPSVTSAIYVMGRAAAGHEKDPKGLELAQKIETFVRAQSRLPFFLPTAYSPPTKNPLRQPLQQILSMGEIARPEELDSQHEAIFAALQAYAGNQRLDLVDNFAGWLQDQERFRQLTNRSLATKDDAGLYELLILLARLYHDAGQQDRVEPLLVRALITQGPIGGNPTLKPTVEDLLLAEPGSPYKSYDEWRVAAKKQIREMERAAERGNASSPISGFLSGMQGGGVK